MKNHILYIYFILGLIIIILFFILFFIATSTRVHSDLKPKSNICRGYLTDKEYLEHMIPHHQVAVDISILLQEKTKNPKMQEILRKIIWVQNYEIKLMRNMLKGLPENDMSTSEMDMVGNYTITTGDLTKPNKVGLTKTYCDPHFFDPKKHMEHMKHMKLDDKMYVEHMIPHHQVAVDMSKVLLTNTKNDFMIYLANRIILSQNAEIILLNDMLSKNPYSHQSKLII